MKFKFLLGLISCLSACSPRDDAVQFITTSNLGINTDTETASASVGYDRQELIIAPIDPNTGSIHPLYADIQQDRDLTRPRIKQVFATGPAARIISSSDTSRSAKEIKELVYEEIGSEKDAIAAAQANESPAATKPHKKTKGVVVFGTTSNIGLKLSTKSGSAEVQLGFKRKESARIPVVTNPDGYHEQVPSLFGSLSVGTDAQLNKSPASTPFELKQIIATGAAADNAAATTEVREAVAEKIEERVKKDICGGEQTQDAEGKCVEASTSEKQPEPAPPS